MSNATMLLEHAESRFKLGPLKSKNQLTLFASIVAVPPVDEYFEANVGSFAIES